MAEIVLDKVTKSFPDGTVAVREFDLTIADGEFLILVGPSGCGKSTTLNMIAGLEEITTGELRIDGRRVNEKAPKDRDMAMVFQSYALYPNMSVRENIAFPLRLRKVAPDVVSSKVDEMARLLELSQVLDRKPANLSGGQRQRVAMGRAIVRDPKAFLMDEPLSNLDAKLRVQMRTLVSRLQRRLGTTTVYVTHDQTEAMTLGDRLVVMRGGVVQQIGPPQELYDSPANLFVAGFIGSPPMNFLYATPGADGLESPLGTLPLRFSQPVILGARPEHFADAAMIDEETRRRGIEFDATPDVVESMGSDKYAYFVVQGPRATSAELEELAADSGAADLPTDGTQLVARLPAASDARENQPIRLWFDVARAHAFDPQTGQVATADGR
ncbi:ABC transporter ATP-binding protein [Allorhizocola rhizosphaerae]|uniref:ABC transporter ATP-binding protein n=1 Tax=Allorhizocola rhizosphaerae TaxID=1872709 RepID=UPI000E3CB969|nr:ABC transporter ATP-binding protein [Allorhizocola rhizosphaerae]